MIRDEDLDTPVPNTWCPGCGNFGILSSVKRAVAELVNEGFAERKDFVTVTGIGCHGKIYDYLNLNGFYSIHGRGLPTGLGIKVANRELHVLVFGGDGDVMAEGISHFIHASRYNIDLTLILHNNQVFALTTGQATPTTEKGFRGKSTPLGTFEEPLNPLVLAIESGATFVAREFAFDFVNLKDTVKKAVKHKGFALVEVLQPCVSFHNTTQYFRERVYRVSPAKDREEALRMAREWNYTLDPNARVPVGIFYVSERPTYEESWPSARRGPYWKRERNVDWREVVRAHLVRE